MNVLPLVSAFILLFAIGSYTFIHQFHAAYFEQRSYSGSMQAQRNFRAKLIKAAYKKCPGKAPPSNKEKKPNEEETEYASPRDQINPLPESKLNIHLLAKEDNPHLHQVATDLIARLYQYTSLDIDSEALLTALINLLKRAPSASTFEQLLAAAPKEEAPFLYKLIKGTTNYQVSTSKGIPPLGDFFSLDSKDEKKPIHFAHASRPLLQALFGDIIAPQIINEERHKWEAEKKHKFLKQDELEALLVQHRKNPPDYTALISFSTQSSGKTSLRLTDKKNTVQLRF